MAARLISMKYQLKLTQATMRMRLNNDTSFVRRLTNPFERNGMEATGVSDG